jgi:copper chaperone
MKINYELSGMNCGGCVSSVKSALLKLPEVQEAEIQLHPQSAVLTMSKAIDVKDLQAQLKKTGHYTIKEVATQ